MKKPNGLAKWVLIILAVTGHLVILGGIFYRQAVMDAKLENDVVHLQRDVTEIKEDIKSINNRLWEGKGTSKLFPPLPIQPPKPPPLPKIPKPEPL